MALYATAAELASFLQKDLDTSSATLVLTIASARFAHEADTAWSATTVTYSTQGSPDTGLGLPYKPVTAVSQVRLNGSIITGWTLRLNALYRSAGFGSGSTYLPDLVEVDLTYGFTTVTDDVKGAVLETAGQAYDIPVSAVISETIDDYAVRFATTGGGLQLTPAAAALAASYRGIAVA